MTTFSELGLRDDLVAALTQLGYEAPTPIQERTIPILLAGRDLIGQAQTGTGKTAAFALPILSAIDPASKHTQALVLAPTRELAMQVAEAIHTYAQKTTPVSVLPVYGGAPLVHQIKRLDRGAHVVVGTPGRLIDVLDRGSLKLGNVKMIVLDEADEMLKMGFIDDIEKILGAAPTPRQTALFSATMPEQVMRIAKRYLTDPERVAIEHKALTGPDIEQRFLNVSEGQKLEALTQILELQPSDASLIFRRTKNGAAELAEKLEGRGFTAVAMHGDMTQSLREAVIRRLRAGQVEIVVATDVAARGLDVEQITHVINYDIPYDVEAYVHRIGRTGRAGRSGLATLFITPRERGMMRAIERYTGTSIKPMKMPTRADVAAHRVSLFKETLKKDLEKGDLDLYLGLVEQLAEEGEHDMAEIAAAACRLASTTRPLAAQPEPVYAPARERAERPERSFDNADGDRGPRPERNDSGEPKVRLSMSVGKRDGIRPADVVGSIANEADVPGHDIGPIEIREDVTYVTIPERFADQVIEKVGRARFRGRAVQLKVATDYKPQTERPQRDSYERPQRPFRPSSPARSGSQDRPSRPYTPDRPSRPYTPDRPQRSYRDRDAEPRPPRYDSGDRPSRDAREGPPRPGRPMGKNPFARPDRQDRGPSRGPGDYPPRKSYGQRDDRPSGPRSPSRPPTGSAFNKFVRRDRDSDPRGGGRPGPPKKRK